MDHPTRLHAPVMEEGWAGRPVVVLRIGDLARTILRWAVSPVAQAQLLAVSPSTVDTNIRSIYTGLRSMIAPRPQRARELRLLVAGRSR